MTNSQGIGIARLPVAAALASLDSRADGLSSAEAARRQGEFGANRVEEARREPVWLALAREFSHFFALILWLAAILALFAEYYEPGQGMLELGLAIIGVIVVNGLFSFFQAYRAERALAALRGLLPQWVEMLRVVQTVTLAAADIVPGDVLLLGEGDLVPADARRASGMIGWGSGSLPSRSEAVGQREATKARPGDNVVGFARIGLKLY